MRIRTEVPVEGRIIKYENQQNIVGEKVVTMDMEHLEFIYGASGVSGVTCRTDYEPAADGTLRAFLTFNADTPAEQKILDAWAAKIDLDDVSTMRAKFDAAPVQERDGADYKPVAIGTLDVDDTVEAKQAIITASEAL
jgi:hypothetical protein